MSDFDGSQPDPEISDEEADEVLDLLGQAFEDVDVVPPWLTRFAYESHRLIGMDGELARIAADSFVSPEPGSRSTSGVRAIEFVVEGASLRLEISDTSVRGSVAPAETTVEVVGQKSTESVEVNRRGFFGFDAPEGPFRLVLEADGRVIRTDWVTLR